MSGKNGRNLERQPEDNILYEILSQIPYSRKASLSKVISERLRDAIVSGKLPAGYSFPNENEMCNMLEIGRSSLREAYSQLQILNLITRTKSGTVVNGPEKVNNLMNFDVIIDHTDILDVMEFREIVEVGIAYNAALRATAADIDRLNGLLDAQLAARGNLERMTDIDTDFHSLLAEMSGNQLLMMSMESVRPKFRNASYWVFSRQLDYTVDEHRGIVDALRKNDGSAAKKAMRKHLHSIRKVIINENRG